METLSIREIIEQVDRGRLAANEAEVLDAAACPTSLFNDRYDEFLEERSALLARRARVLTE